MQADRNPVGFRPGTQGRAALWSEGVKRLRARIQPEIDIVEPMGSGPAQAVFDGLFDANINTDTVDQLHGFSSPAAGGITRYGGGMARRRGGLWSSHRRQNSMPFWARIPWVCNGCLTSRISVTRSAASINSLGASRPVMIRCSIGGLWAAIHASTSAVSSQPKCSR